MFNYLKNQQKIFLFLISALHLTAVILFWPANLLLTNLLVLFIGTGTAIVFIIRKHLECYHQAECVREKMVRNLTLDILGFLLAMGVAMYVGGMAGGYLGLRAGLWFGLLAGFAGGFLAAWLVRSTWGKLVIARIQ